MVKSNKEFLTKAIGKGSIRSFEERCCLSHGALAPVLRGDSELSLMMAKKICEKTDVTMEEYLAINLNDVYSEKVCETLSLLRKCSDKQLDLVKDFLTTITR